MDLIKALEDANVPWRSGSESDEIRICCPFCEEEGHSTPDSDFKLQINLHDFWFCCYRCRKGSKNTGYSKHELTRAFRLGMFDVTRTKQVKKMVKGEVKLPEDYKPIYKADRSDKWERRAYKYLKNRVPIEQAKEKEIGFSLADRFYHHRIIIPVMYKGKLYGIIARDFTNKQKNGEGKLLPYKNSIGYKSVYNLPRRKKNRADKAVIVEGAFDALAIERSFIARVSCDSLASLGTSLTPLQVKQLRSYKEVTLWPDPDIQGMLGFLRMAKPLWGKTTLSIVIPDFNDERDPDKLLGKEIRQRYRERKVINDLDMFTTRWKMKLKED